MNSSRGRDRLLGGVGLVAAAIYVLACASFSPDDSQVLFASYDAATKSPMVALYDRKADSVENLLVFGGLDSGCPVFAAHWTPDGRRAVALWVEEDAFVRILTLPRKGREPARMFWVPTDEGAGLDLVCRPAFIGPYVFFGGTGGVSRLNLETGHIATNAKPALLFRACGRRLAYINGPKFEMGLMDPESFAMTPVLILPEAEVSAGEVKNDFFCLSRDGEQAAFLKAVDGGPNLTLTTYRRGKPEGRVAVAVPGGGWRITCHPQWSPDCKTLYAPVWRDVESKGEEFGILEIPAAGGEARCVPVFTVPDSSEKSAYQLALSHDGKTIAFSTLYLAEKQWKDGAAENCALFLVDLASDPRKVKRVPIPLPDDGW